MADKWNFEKGEIYQLLEISLNANNKEIKSAYKRMALILHPDKNSDPASLQSFLLLNKAIGILIDQEQRLIYNERLKRWKDRDKREAEMAAARKVMKEDLLKREEAFESKRKAFKSTKGTEQEIPIQQTNTIDKKRPSLPELEVLFPQQTTRDNALDFLQNFGEIERFRQTSAGHYKFSFSVAESLHQFVRWNEENPQKLCKIVTNLSTLIQRHVDADNEISLDEFLAYEKEIIGKLQQHCQNLSSTST